MLLLSLLFIPLLGIFTICVLPEIRTDSQLEQGKPYLYNVRYDNLIKTIGLSTSIINFFISVLVFLAFNFSSNHFQFVQEHYKINSFDFFLGVDGLSIYFVLLTTIIIPIALLSN